MGSGWNIGRAVIECIAGAWPRPVPCTVQRIWKMLYCSSYPGVSKVYCGRKLTSWSGEGKLSQSPSLTLDAARFCLKTRYF